MSKGLLFKVLVALAFVALAVVWVLSAMEIVAIEFAWVIAIFAFVLGILFIFKGLFTRTLGLFKKMNILLGAGMIIAGVLSLVNTIIEDAWVLPIIALIITVALFACVLATGGKKWDQADNQNAGYKNYYQRKAEEEAKNKKED